jgi:hypothetical protein
MKSLSSMKGVGKMVAADAALLAAFDLFSDDSVILGALGADGDSEAVSTAVAGAQAMLMPPPNDPDARGMWNIHAKAYAAYVTAAMPPASFEGFKRAIQTLDAMDRGALLALSQSSNDAAGALFAITASLHGIIDADDVDDAIESGSNAFPTSEQE